VVRYRKKLVVFLITVSLGGGVLLVCSARSAADAEQHASNRRGTESENSKSQSGSLFENDPDISTRKSDRPSSRELFFKMMVSVLFLIALGAAAI
jgi:hypothetical protein